MTAPGAVDGRVPTWNLLWLGATLGGSTLIAMAVLANEPVVCEAVQWLVQMVNPAGQPVPAL